MAWLVAILRALALAWLSTREAFGRGKAEAIARANVEAAEAERRAGAVRDKTVEQIARDLDGGGF